MRDILSVDLSL